MWIYYLQPSAETRNLPGLSGARLQAAASSRFGTNFRADAIQVPQACVHVCVCACWMKPVAAELHGGRDKREIDCL